MSELKILNNFLFERNFILFKLTGGLGNQLFALSEAFCIANKFNKNILLDVTEVDHRFEEDNGFVWEKHVPLQDAFSIAEISDHYFFKKIDFVNLNNNEYSQDLPYLTGWQPSFERIVKSGLWSPNNLPSFLNSGAKSISDIALHIRLGDYLYVKPFAPLPWKYYKKALKIIRPGDKKIALISDEPQKLLSIYPKFKKYNCSYSKNENPLDSMTNMVCSTVLVMGNSTYSYWSYFFGNHAKIIVPSPFYNFNKNFDKHLWKSEDITSKKIIFIDYAYAGKIIKKIKNLIRGIYFWV
jgi:hypothetical protein